MNSRLSESVAECAGEKVMKVTTAKRISIVFALLLFALACPINAMPPVPHLIKGDVQRIDAQQRELVVTNGHYRTVLRWKNGTHACCLKSGDTVKAYYRKAAGSNVISDLSVLSPICCK